MLYTFLTRPSRNQLEQILALYRTTGWWPDAVADTAKVADIIAGSHCFLAAVEKDGIIAMGRAISDRISDAYIQDVTVAPEFQRKGIGSAIIQKLVERLHRDGLFWIGLIAERNSHGFYERLGFKRMPDAVPMLMESK